MRRREFLAAAAGIAGLDRRLGGGQRVEADATIFYGQPDGGTELVRFAAPGVDAPAGRLRVYDHRRRLLGTAGVVRTDAGLYGELWLALGGETRIMTELEAPGVRGVRRDSHVLRPRPRWTLLWLPVARPEPLLAELERLAPLPAALQSGLHRSAGVRGNPWTAAAAAATDHVGLLRAAAAAATLEDRFGVPLSRVALLERAERLGAAHVLALTGWGVGAVARAAPRAPDTAPEWWTAPDDSRVLVVPVRSDGDAVALGFAGGLAEMMRRVERWLPAEPGADPFDVITGIPEDDAVAVGRTVREWNRRFAFPRIVVAAPDDVRRAVERRHGRIAVRRPPPPTDLEVPGASRLAAMARDAEAARATRMLMLLTPAARSAAPDSGPAVSAEAALGVIAARIDARPPGHVVFNPSPFARTDAVRLPDGRTRIVTDVPALGYVVLPTTRATAPDAPPAAAAARRVVEWRVETPRLALALDPRSGAISSLITRSDGRDWVAPQSDGLNAVPGAIVDDARREELPGIGVRFDLRRRSPAHGELRSTVTVYHALDWIDVENDAALPADDPAPYGYAFAMPDSAVAWEVPAGHEELPGPAPAPGVRHLRWLRLRTERGSVLFRALDAPYLSVDRRGTVLSYAPRGRARYRVAVTPAAADVAAAARFGWNAEPMLAVPLPPGGGGRLPRHRSLLVVDQPAVALIGLAPAADRGRAGESLVAYFQELLGAERYASVGAGLLGFAAARPVDLLGRAAGEALPLESHGVTFRLRPWGITALELTGLALRTP